MCWRVEGGDRINSGTQMKVPLREWDLDVCLSECLLDREAKIGRYAPLHARILRPYKQRELKGRIAEVVESNLRAGLAKAPRVLVRDADEHVADARRVRAVRHANFDLESYLG